MIVLFGDFGGNKHFKFPILKMIDFGEATSDNAEFQSKLECVMTNAYLEIPILIIQPGCYI